ncbi:hypothetical protein HWV62_29344 [Athelia sp. TMB]|nr:hypothetical protein HWV62_29344 [Athelia sp. TMB]
MLPGSKRRPGFQFYVTSYPSDEEEDSAAPTSTTAAYRTTQPSNKAPTTQHRHVRFNNKGHGAQTTYISTPASPSKERSLSPGPTPQWNTVPLPNFTTHPFLDPAYVHELDMMDTEGAKRNRTKSDTPLLNWIPEVDLFLTEILRLEGRGDFINDTLCPFCSLRAAEYRCRDCFGGQLYCKLWNGMFFEHVTLKSMGMRVQLGHGVGECCSNPEASYDDNFTVIDMKAIHQIHLDYCACETAQPRHVQLLRASWYPATTIAPRTAATFRVLEHFQLLTFESKASGFALYNTLARSTDNTGTNPPADSYPAFMRIVREWRHIKLLKRAGRGHQPEGPGPDTARQGDCAVVCPACPHPGRNLPEDWDKDKDKLWLYALFVAIDANFRLKRKDVSSDAVDPSLNRGRAYFVEELRYKTHLAGYGDQVETTSDCVKHDAVKSANKFTAGLAATGAGTVDCARHNMKRPHAVGDLQAGERQVNIDYLLFSSLLGSLLIMYNISYDICCQWSIHLLERMAKYPTEYQFDLSYVMLKFLVPKFHLPAHVERCQTAYSFNFMRYVGRTDGEAPERGWADINAVAGSTQEMGPGSRRDTLDDHFGDWNHRKIVAMSAIFLRKIKDAVPERAQQVDIFEELSENLPPESVAKWTVAVEAWERDRFKPNPFVAITETVTERDVKLQLAQEESVELLRGENDILHHTLSPSVCITVGMDLESHQRRLHLAAGELNQNSTAIQQTKVQLRENALKRKIDAWIKVQEVYMPSAAIIRARDPDTAAAGAPEVAAHSIALLLPSALIRNADVDIKLLRYEWRLRQAQARDALYALRQVLRVQAHLVHFKTRFHRGQAANTRSSDTLSRIRAKVDESVACYRIARAAIATLGFKLKETGWAQAFPLLKEEDVRQMAEGVDGESEGTRTMSWIWTTAGVGGNKDSAEGPQEELRIQWCKARARAFRWSEEIFLLLEEMTRVELYHTWHGNWWEEQSVRREGLTAEEAEGFAAYAFRQAQIRFAMRDVCLAAWDGVTEYVELGARLDEEDI